MPRPYGIEYYCIISPNFMGSVVPSSLECGELKTRAKLFGRTVPRAAADSE